jgi:hypothetical protein
MPTKAVRDLLFRFAPTTAHLEGELIISICHPLSFAWSVDHGQLRCFVAIMHRIFPVTSNAVHQAVAGRDKADHY